MSSPITNTGHARERGREDRRGRVLRPPHGSIEDPEAWAFAVDLLALADADLVEFVWEPDGKQDELRAEPVAHPHASPMSGADCCAV